MVIMSLRMFFLLGPVLVMAGNLEEFKLEKPPELRAVNISSLEITVTYPIDIRTIYDINLYRFVEEAEEGHKNVFIKKGQSLRNPVIFVTNLSPCTDYKYLYVQVKKSDNSETVSERFHYDSNEYCKDEEIIDRTVKDADMEKKQDYNLLRNMFIGAFALWIVSTIILIVYCCRKTKKVKKVALERNPEYGVSYDYAVGGSELQDRNTDYYGHYGEEEEDGNTRVRDMNSQYGS